MKDKIMGTWVNELIRYIETWSYRMEKSIFLGQKLLKLKKWRKPNIDFKIFYFSLYFIIDLLKVVIIDKERQQKEVYKSIIMCDVLYFEITL